ncbi:hypothetical protein N7465_010418, partial [Penicillium sp. CMV-2018d]
NENDDQPNDRPNVRIIMNKINESAFQKPGAQDDKGLEEEAKSLLNGKAVVLETEYFNGKVLDSSIAPAVLIHGDEGEASSTRALPRAALVYFQQALKQGVAKEFLF